MAERDPLKADGRRRRSQTSRDRIVAAMLELIAEGQVAPSADQVATRAAVGLRSVFRHFRDMETLYAEMTASLAAQYEMWLVPYDSGDWRGQLDETLERRVATYDRLIPFKRAADAHRHQSPAIAAEHARTLGLMRERLSSILPDAIRGDSVTFETIDLLLSFDTWLRLRLDQRLSRDEARTLIAAQLARLTG